MNTIDAMLENIYNRNSNPIPRSLAINDHQRAQLTALETDRKQLFAAIAEVRALLNKKK